MIYVDVEGEAQGPFTADELSALWRAGEIDPGARYWYRGMKGWFPVAEFVPPPENPRTPARAIELTTESSFARRAIEREVEIITAEAILASDAWREFFGALTADALTARGDGLQRALRKARQSCLDQLRHEAEAVSADGVLGVRLAHTEITGQGKATLLVIASGTAARLGPPPV